MREKFMFMGVSGDELIERQQVFTEFNIKSAADLRIRLATKAAETEALVEVRDSKNRDRLLGHIERRKLPAKLEGRYLNMVVMPPMQGVYSPDPVAEAISRVCLNIERDISPDGWSMKVFFTTDTPLGVLLMLDSFRLPGETPSQVRHRRYHSL